MSKADRRRQKKEEELRAMREAEEKRKKKNRIIKKVVLFSLLGAIVVTAVSFLAVKLYNDDLDSGRSARNTAAVKSEHYTVDNTMMSYFIYDAYNSMMSRYGSYFTSNGFDETKPLKEQEYTDGVSWFDYFASSALASVRQMLILAEEAYKNGFSLSDAELEAVKTRVGFLEPSEYGRGVTSDDILRAETLSTLAARYDASILASLEPESEEIDEYYKNNSFKFDGVTYLTYNFYYELGRGSLTFDEAQTYANDLGKTKTEDEFREFITDYLKKTTPEITDAEIQSELDKITVVNPGYSEELDYSVWALNKERKKGDTFVTEMPGYTCFSTFMIVSPPSKDESPTKNVRHILIGTDRYGADAKKIADEVYEKLKQQGSSESAIDMLALAYSSDPGSAESGGLYDNLSEGSTVQTFNDWCFDEERKYGDTDIVVTSYGYHVMFYVGDGLSVYRSNVRSEIINSRYDVLYSDCAAANVLTENEGNIKKIPERK